MDWKTIYEGFKIRNWAVLFVLSVIGYGFMSHSRTLGIILGGIVVIANFNIFQHTICHAFSSAGTESFTKVLIIVKYYLRLLALAVIIFILVTKDLVDPVGFAIGLSTMVISIVLFGISRACKMRIGGAT
ncbi:MAG: ATP synthase subunit I [Deltaproteobacteria bacterium]|nr:ATP synthase subunit I [Deltaproteobacteria bacterium]